ncbi:MAG: agmatine deiminase family protein [Acidobacteriota bacterium]
MSERSILSGLTPRELGYFMPPEWHRHEATWLTWPTNPVTWPDGRLERVQAVYVDAIRTLIQGERVRILVDAPEEAELLRERLHRTGDIELGRVEIFIIPTVDAWIRDYGPNFLLRQTERGWEKGANRWRFNAWGGKYPDLEGDDAVAPQILEALGVPYFEPGIVLEGGSIEVNGAGLCLTTRQCLLNPNRNPHLDAREIERTLRDYLGVREVIWLEEGIAGDDTDGHVDDVARFVAPDLVVAAYEPDPADPNHAPLREVRRELRRRQAAGYFRVLDLPMPEPLWDGDQRLPASYANFYIANRTVLVPCFGCRQDGAALGILRQVFPGREVVPIDARDLVYGLGAIHCLSQQEPAVPGGPFSRSA